MPVGTNTTADPQIRSLAIFTPPRSRARMNLKGGSNWKSLSARMLSQEKLPRGPYQPLKVVGSFAGLKKQE